MRDGGPAFPSDTGRMSQNEGMSLRDWFAGQAMSACLTLAINIELAGRELTEDAPIVAAKMSYRVADAMLKERGK